jgi:glycerate kinase
VMDAVGFEPRLEGADLVITGEGSFDAQSLRGKVPAGVLRAAELAGAPVLILCGVSSAEARGATVRSLVDLVGAGAALGDAGGSLEALAATVAADHH